MSHVGSLSLMAPLSPQQNWQQKAEALQRELYQRNQQLNEAEDALRQGQLKMAVMERGLAELRTVLTPLYQGLAHIFGEIEGMGVVNETQASNPRKSAIWESWKQKLSGPAGKAIDALMLHGELTVEQLRLHLGCANRTCYNIIGELNKAKLINKNGGRVSLKELV